MPARAESRAHSQTNNPTQKVRSVKKSRRAWSACRVRRSVATETNTNYPAPRGKPCLFWKRALFATWSLIVLGLLLRLVLKLRTDCRFGLSRGPHSQQTIRHKKHACSGSHRQTRSVRANQFATQIGEPNTTYAQSRSLSGAVLSGACFFATWSLIALGSRSGRGKIAFSARLNSKNYLQE